MRGQKGEYFLKIVNKERYQKLFDHPEELRKIIAYAKRLMQYEKCFDYSFRDNCMKMELLQVAVQRILQEYGIEVGPAALAWRNGWVLLINEFSAAPPEVWVSANDLLEGLPLEIDQTGEVIDRHPLARIVFTDNTRGHSTELAAGYFGRQIQDRSVIDRMWHLRCEGLHEADEARVLLASLEADLVVRAGEAAAEEICALAARAAAGSRCKAAQSPLGFENRSFALSIRAARRFAELTLRYAAGDLPVSADPIAAAADTAVGNALDRPVRDALVTYLKTIFGERITELRQMRAESSAPVRRNPRSSRPKACTETPALS